MEWELVSGNKRTTPTTPQVAPQPIQQEPQEEPGFGSRLGGSLSNLGLSIGAGAAKYPAQLLDLASSVAAGQPRVTESGEITSGVSPEIQQQLALTPKVEAVRQDIKQQLPEGLGLPFEDVLNKAAEALPSFAAAGGGVINAAARALGSEAGRAVAKNLDYGEFGQFIGSAIGAGLVSGLLNPRDLKKVENLEYGSYTKSMPKGGAAQIDIPLGNKAYADALTNTDLHAESSKQISEHLKNIEPLLKAGKGAIKTVFEKMKKINEMRREIVPYIKEKGVRKEVDRIFRSISDGLKQDQINAQQVFPGLNTEGLINGSSISYARNQPSTIMRAIKLIKQQPEFAVPAAAVGYAAKAAFGKGAPIVGSVGALANQGFIEPLLASYRSPAAAQQYLGKTVPQTFGGILTSR
jgi:hypothetical protein